jgi:hypothetical protein
MASRLSAGDEEGLDRQPAALSIVQHLRDAHERAHDLDRSEHQEEENEHLAQIAMPELAPDPQCHRAAQAISGDAP